MSGRVRRWLARALILAGISAFGWVAVVTYSSRVTRQEYRDVLDAAHAREAPPVEPGLPATMPLGEPIGTLVVPRLGLTAVVAEGDDKPVLDDLAGHLPDTPLPWNDGNSAVAAHRDGLFRPLRNIRVGDTLRFESLHGDFDYRVTETYVVDPDDVWVLNPTLEPTLTLISCYPFDFIGHAPQRFIVKAARLRISASATPDAGTRPASRAAGGSPS